MQMSNRCITLAYIYETSFFFSSDNSIIQLKLTVENVVDSKEQLDIVRQLATEINPESTVQVISIEKQCIELIININSHYLTNKDLFLGAITQFLRRLLEKQAFIWKGDTVTIVIVIDEGIFLNLNLVLFKLCFLLIFSLLINKNTNACFNVCLPISFFQYVQSVPTEMNG